MKIVISMVVDYKALGLKIKKLRKSKNLTQDKLAEKAGCSKSFIGCVENNTSIPSIDTIVQISAVLGVTPDYFLAGTARDLDRPQRIAQKAALCAPSDQELLEIFIDSILEKKYSSKP